MEIGFVYAIGAAIVWGLVYTIDQKILAQLSPLMLILVNSIISLIIVLPFALLDQAAGIKSLSQISKTSWLLIIGTAGLATLASYYIFASIKHLDASAASIIEISYPFFVALFSFIVFRTSPNLAFFLGAGFVFLGSFIIVKYTS